MTVVWDQLEALSLEEAQALAAERLDDVVALQARRAAVIAALPAPLPEEAGPALRRALAAQRANADVLRARRDAIAGELARLRRGRDGVRGYARTFAVRP